MKLLRLGDAAWLAIAAYEVLCPPGEMLSEAVDRWLGAELIPTRRRRKHATELFIVYTALHVANRLPERVDLYARAARRFRRGRRGTIGHV